MGFTGLFYTLLQVADAAVARNVLVALVQVVYPIILPRADAIPSGLYPLNARSWRARRSEEISWEVLYFIPNRSVAGMLKREAMAPISATRLTA